MRVLVTGGAGFIGSMTVRMLAKQRHSIIVVDDFTTGKVENINDIQRVGIIPSDITDVVGLEQTFYDFQPQAVIHLAAQSAISKSIADPKRDADVNAFGTLNIINLCNKYKISKLVFSSTSAVYDERKSPYFGYTEDNDIKPASPYGISKLTAESYIRNLFYNHIIFRYGNVYGPRQVPIGENQVIARALAHFTYGDEFVVTGHGHQKRDFIFVEDVARMNIYAMTSARTGTFNLATGKSRSVNEVLSAIERIYGVKYEWEHSKRNDPRGDVHMNISRLREKIGCSFTPLEEGLSRTIDWWRQKEAQ